MNVNKQAVLVFCVFAVALGSGIILGSGLSRKVAGGQDPMQPQQEHDPQRWLATRLELTPDQQEKLTPIFEQARNESTTIDERRRQIDRTREETLAKFVEALSPEQRAAYDRIQSDYRKQREQVGKDTEDVYNKRRDAIKRILSVEQLVKYEEILKNRPQGGRRWGGPGREGGRGGPRGGPAISESRPAEPVK